MAGFAGDDPFDFEDYSDGEDFSYAPFDCDEGEEFCVSGFAFPNDDGGDGDGEVLCVSGFAFPDDSNGLGVEDRASQSTHEEPILETLGRSFDSDDGLSMFLPHLVSALDLADDTSEGETAGDGGGVEGLILGGLDREPRTAIEETAHDDGDDGIGLMLSGFDPDPRPVMGGFQTLVDADDGWGEAAGDDDIVYGGGLMLSGFDVGPTPASGAFRMLVEDIDSDDGDLLDVLAARVGVAGAQSRRLPASRAAVEALPEVAPSEEEASCDCAVCKDGIAAGQLLLRLPCKHFFHGECIRPWLAIRNTCPVCRYELPTGDAEYDRRRRTAGGASPAQHGAPAQSGGAGREATVGAEDGTECAAENRLEQSAS